MLNSAKQLPTLRLSQPVGSWICLDMVDSTIEGRRLSLPRHCSKGVQPMLKTVDVLQWLLWQARALCLRAFDPGILCTAVGHVITRPLWYMIAAASLFHSGTWRCVDISAFYWIKVVWRLFEGHCVVYCEGRLKVVAVLVVLCRVSNKPTGDGGRCWQVWHWRRRLHRLPRVCCCSPLACTSQFTFCLLCCLLANIIIRF